MKKQEENNVEERLKRLEEMVLGESQAKGETLFAHLFKPIKFDFVKRFVPKLPPIHLFKRKMTTAPFLKEDAEKIHQVYTSMLSSMPAYKIMRIETFRTSLDEIKGIASAQKLNTNKLISEKKPLTEWTKNSSAADLNKILEAQKGLFMDLLEENKEKVRRQAKEKIEEKMKKRQEYIDKRK